MAKNDSFQAIVVKVCINGKHGPYAVAQSEELGSVTFSLASPVWREKDQPEPGVYIILKSVRKKVAGWRAHSVRFVRPDDEQKAKSKEKGA